MINICQRLGVQNVAAYLDSVPSLRREYYINYIECIPAYIRKERAFLKMFTEAEANLKTLEVDFQLHNAHNCGNKSKRYPNYKNRKNKTTPNGNNITKSDNKSQNDKKPFSQNGNNSKNYKNNYNDNRKGQYKNKFVPNNQYNNKQPGNRGHQVNAIDFDNWGDFLCKKFQEIILTTKMAALITICLLAIMIPSTEEEFIPGYKWENCHSPRISYF
uniref:PGG domain-containing protein n=1 Tax=Strongyloides venezuelensis TaxID=75913 RepID=A0A0K0FZB6_STRVS